MPRETEALLRAQAPGKPRADYPRRAHRTALPRDTTFIEFSALPEGKTARTTLKIFVDMDVPTDMQPSMIPVIVQQNKAILSGYIKRTKALADGLPRYAGPILKIALRGVEALGIDVKYSHVSTTETI